MKLQYEDMCKALAQHSFCFGLPEVTAVCGLQAFGQAEPSQGPSCCSHEKPGLETGKPKLAATRYCPVKKASRGTAKAASLAS